MKWRTDALFCCSHLKPGGWFELQELPLPMLPRRIPCSPITPLRNSGSYISGGLAELGVNFNVTLLLADMMRAAGFVNVTTRIFRVLIGRWPKNKVLKLVGFYIGARVFIDGLQPIALGAIAGA